MSKELCARGGHARFSIKRGPNNQIKQKLRPFLPCAGAILPSPRVKI